MRGIAFMFNLGSPVFDVSPLLKFGCYGTIFVWPLVIVVLLRPRTG